ncbi:hypothetical protein BC940DRAFT_336383 [Gongronella butleri]|nr:hypothetical protein BC940DRAFT_336383 [Gongronella butleri]
MSQQPQAPTTNTGPQVEMSPLSERARPISYIIRQLPSLKRSQQRMHLANYLQIYPEDPKLWALRAKLEVDEDKKDVARAVVEEGLQRVPDDPYLVALQETFSSDAIPPAKTSIDINRPGFRDAPADAIATFTSPSSPPAEKSAAKGPKTTTLMRTRLRSPN